jgi:hypothetical protein
MSNIPAYESFVALTALAQQQRPIGGTVGLKLCDVPASAREHLRALMSSHPYAAENKSTLRRGSSKPSTTKRVNVFMGIEQDEGRVAGVDLCVKVVTAPRRYDRVGGGFMFISTSRVNPTIAELRLLYPSNNAY